VPAAYRDIPMARRLLIGGGLLVLAPLILLAPPPETVAAAIWTRAELTFASGISFIAALLSVRGTTCRVRKVRSWITAAIGLWLIGEIVRNVEVVLGIEAALRGSHVPFIGVLLCAGMAYASALKGQLRPSDELAVYLDGAIVFFATGALMLTAFGEVAGESLTGAVDLTYAIFFLATTGATLLLDLAVRAERRPSGAYVVLVGLVLLGVGFLWRVAAPPAVGLHESGTPAALLSLGVVVVMLGTVTWTDAVDEHPGYVRFASRLRAAMPLIAIAITPLLIAIQFLGDLPAPIEVLNRAAVALVLVSVAVRQSVLLKDRERAVAREQGLGRELSATESKYRALVERQPGVVYLAEPGEHGRWHYVSPQIEPLLGFPAQAWLDDPTLWARQIHADDRELILEREGRLTAGRPEGPVQREYRLCAADGREIWVLEEEMVTQTDDDGTPVLVQGVLVDISQRKRAEQELQASEEQTRTIIETASYAFIGMDTEGRVIDWNRRASETFGWSRDEAMGNILADLIIPEAQRMAHRDGLGRYLSTGEWPLLGKRVEVTALDRDGRSFPIELTIWPIRLSGGVRFNALVDDITLRKQLEDQLRHQALHDPLTGLPNRALFVDRLQHAMDRTERGPAGSIAVLFLDLDDFKTVNDSLGHEAGDRLLEAVAERLGQTLRAGDTAARLGGDEFAILLEEAPDGEPQAVAARILARLSRPLEIESQGVSAMGSIGIALSGDHGSTPEELLRNADLAMYLAKARGKNRHELYEPGMHEQAMRRLSMKAELERALANDELDVHYQPIVALHDGSVIGLEALLRWRGPDGQFVAVPEIIAIAEETGLILPIGRFVMERACRDARRWQEEMGADEKLDIAINVSIVQLESGTLIQDVDRALAESGLPPTSLVLEITESALSTDSLDSVRTIRALRARGIRLALDDFGTGYSSLARLRRFPVDIVKIDRSFVTAINKSREGVLVQSILDLGRSLEMEVVAEGIETEAQMLALRARGATLGQGYYFARPLQQDAVTTVLSIGKLPLPLKRRRTAVARGA
jgi:diguanylate cyclase (GGDEF)-like protein/PAS domain S-box-containing protein